MRSGFTILDVLIVVVIISVLLAILSPAISRGMEQARRTVCQSNLKQIGLGLTMHVNDHDGMLPSVLNAEKGLDQRPRRLQLANLGEYDQDWDGLGRLVDEQYINAPELFYCPSHAGENPFERFRHDWRAGNAEIVVNYHYRWLQGQDRFLDNLNQDVTLVVDGLRTVPDYSHATGNNMLKTDMHVEWFTDSQGLIASYLPPTLDDSRAHAFTARQVMAAMDLGHVPPTRDELDRLSPHINAGFVPRR